MKPSREPFTCPICGEEVPPNAKACRECGSCEKSGWSAQSDYDAVDLPNEDEDFDYDEFLEREFGGKQASREVSWVWWLVGVILLFAFAAMSLHVLVLLK